MAQGLDLMRWLRLGETSSELSRWIADPREEGLAYGRSEEARGISDVVLAPLLVQWADAGYAIQDGPNWLVPPEALYRIGEDPDYLEVCTEVQIPPIHQLAPRLLSKGSLTDTDFTISVSGWEDRQGTSVSGVTGVIGPFVKIGAATSLLPRATWLLLERIGAFARRGDSERTERSHRLAWAEIRRLALVAGARLDEFLYRTVVLAPERVRIGLRRSHLPGEKVVEVIPDFEDSPSNWLEAFDANRSVRDRYDLPTPNGIVQVIVSPDVRTVLDQVKRMPGRRVAGARAEAFIANPFAALGESASRVIDATDFEAERVRAGLTFDRFTVYQDSPDEGQVGAFGLLIESGESGEACTVRVPLSVESAREFLSAARASLVAGRQLCAWEEYEFELLGETANQIDRLERLISSVPDTSGQIIRHEVIYNLEMYSDRVSGIGVEKPYASPYIARRDENRGWIPENLIAILELPPTKEGGESRHVELTDEQLRSLEASVNGARSDGSPTVQVPGIPDPIPIRDIERAVGCFARAKKDAKEGALGDAIDKAPTRTLRKRLLIKPNIEAIDYWKDRGALAALPAPAPVPRALRPDVELKPHQLDGFNWLRHLFGHSPERCGGAVLADDMGLGKTLQILTLIAWAHETDASLQPALIVAPVALLENWREEARKFLKEGSLPILEAYGDALARLRVPKEDVSEQLRQEGLVRFLKPGWIGNAKVVLTTYETLRDLEFSFAAEKWSIFVCDEAQKVKNPNALITRAAKKQNARFKVACTGTPVENNLADLWCLFDFVQPGLLGALNEFGRRYRRPIEAKSDEEKSRVEELRRQIEPQILRRLKSDVARDLPRKIEDAGCKTLPISTTQRTLYAQAVGQYARRTDPNAVTAFKNVLGLLHYLRLLCTDPQQHGLSSFRAEALADYRRKAPKLDWLLNRLGEIRSRGEKVLIFCEFKDIQRLLQHYIAKEFKYSADIINGDTSASFGNEQSRQKRIRTFQESLGFGAIILSPLAVGFGVNIQAANHVVHYTRTWNPAKEDQATDRAYRIGQTRDVHVYCPVVTASDFTTFDVRLDELLTRKRSLAGDMLNGAGDVQPNEFDIGGVSPPGAQSVAPKCLALEDVLRMLPRHFEAYTAVLWNRQGYAHVTLTPGTGDGGVDVVAIQGSEGELVQCKTASAEGRQLGWEAIKDVVTGEAGYKRLYPNVTFRKVCVTTQYFNAGAHEHARHNNVQLIDQAALRKLMAEHEIALTEVESLLYRDWTTRS